MLSPSRALVVLVPLGDLIDRRKLMAGHPVLTAVGAVPAATAGRVWMLFAGLVIAGLFPVVVQTTVAYSRPGADCSASDCSSHAG